MRGSPRSRACASTAGSRCSPTCISPSSAHRRRRSPTCCRSPRSSARQSDLLLAAGATGKPVNVKKGQWMHPEGMRGAVDKVRAGSDHRTRGDGARHLLRLRRSRRRHALVRAHARGVQRAGDLRRHAQRATTGTRRRRQQRRRARVHPAAHLRRRRRRSRWSLPRDASGSRSRAERRAQHASVVRRRRA